MKFSFLSLVDLLHSLLDNSIDFFQIQVVLGDTVPSVYYIATIIIIIIIINESIKLLPKISFFTKLILITVLIFSRYYIITLLIMTNIFV